MTSSTTIPFQQTLYEQRNSVVDEFCQRKIALVFEQDVANSKLGVRCCSEENLIRYKKKTKNNTGVLAPIGQATITTLVDGQQFAHCSAVSTTDRYQKLRVELAQLRSLLEATRADYRVFFIRQDNSHSRLQITKEQYEILCAECRVFPKLLEYLLDFRFKTCETEIGPPRMAFNPIFDPNPVKDQLGFETAYVVRFIEFTNRPHRTPYSLREFAVYHKFIPNGQDQCSTLMLFGSSQRTQDYIDNFLGQGGDPYQAHPFELHIVFLDLAVASWRPYLLYLYEIVRNLAKKAHFVEVGKTNPLQSSYQVEIEDAQSLKEMEDQTNDMLLCLASTQDSLDTLLAMYHRRSSAKLKQSIVQGTPWDRDIVLTLENQLRDVAYTRKKAEALLAKAQNTRALISSILEYINGNNMDKQMAALQALQKQGHEENLIMHDLAKKSHRDSASVRILTIITLIYLPCTVVSSFYSTQFVSRESTLSGGTKLEYAHNWWLFFAVSTPMTVLTIGVWYIWANARDLKKVLDAQRQRMKRVAVKQNHTLA